MHKIYNKVNILVSVQHGQRGAVLMVMLVILVVGATTFLVHSLNSTTLEFQRNQTTAAALAQAKEALLGYAASVDLNGTSNRPGDLPCPAQDLSGTAGNACGNALGTTGQALRLGRLPWKTLGLPELRDGSGEQLWYAVSNNFKKNTRTALLNSDTVGTITVRAADGSLLHDGSGSSGAVAIIIAPGNVLQRSDKATPQDRSSTGVNSPENYLEIANGEDNANFADSTVNGFIQGSVKDATGKVILNDQLLVITQYNIMQAIQKRVAGEVINALNFYYSFHYFYPRPADFSDSSCLGNGDLASCNSAATSRGRIPATPATAWDLTSILRGASSNNWFQANGWREVIFYAVASACTNGTTNCSGTGYLTLNSPPGSPYTSQKVVVIATGTALPGQSHATGSPKNILSNYLEDENIVPLDDTYTQHASVPFNDISLGIP